MRNKVMKLWMTALLLAVAVPFVKAQVHVGDILCEGDQVVSPSDYNKANHNAIGVVFYVDNSGQHGWAVSLYNDGTCAWGGYGKDSSLDNASSRMRARNDLDGYANTKKILEEGGDYPAFVAVDFENGWYLPALGQMKQLFANYKEVNATLAKTGGNQFRPTGYTYWSSTEGNVHDAWYMCSIGGIGRTSDSFNDCKSTPRYVRSVRSF